MNLTLGNWIFIGIVFIVGVLSSVLAYTLSFNNNKRNCIITSIVAIVITLGFMFGLNWYNTSTASGMRKYKDFQSEMANGIDRELVITAEDGREIFRYKGKFDLDMDNEGNYLRFETQEGKRYTIEYGIQDTVIVIEK